MKERYYVTTAGELRACSDYSTDNYDTAATIAEKLARETDDKVYVYEAREVFEAGPVPVTRNKLN